MNQTQAVLPATFKLDARITGGIESYTIEWLFGNESPGSHRDHVLHTFHGSGTYNVSLVVSD
ncbi:MAG: PKD domain-containing protein [Thermoproteota archaeon]|nr:PKD domain-containing protein [Thermoproteota archaeon]